MDRAKIFFISKKFTSVGSVNTCNFFDIFWKKLQRLDQPTLFFWKWKNFDFKKNYNYGIKAPLKSHSCIFFWNQIFFISKEITSAGWSNRCKFFWNALDPTLVIFLTFFEKNYNDWIKSFYKSKWTGLVRFKYIVIDVCNLAFESLVNSSTIWKREDSFKMTS